MSSRKTARSARFSSCSSIERRPRRIGMPASSKVAIWRVKAVRALFGIPEVKQGWASGAETAARRRAGLIFSSRARLGPGLFLDIASEEFAFGIESGVSERAHNGLCFKMFWADLTLP